MSETVELTVYLKVASDMSIGIYENEPEFGVEQELVFIPLSQVEDIDYIGLSEGQIITIEIPEWLANEKGLI